MKASRGNPGSQTTGGTQDAAVDNVTKTVVVDRDKLCGKGTAYKTGHGSTTGANHSPAHTGEHPRGRSDPGP